MDAPSISPLAYANTPNNNANNNLIVLTPESSPVLPPDETYINNSSPAVVVTLSPIMQNPTTPLTYEEPYVDVVQVRKQNDTGGKAATTVTNQLANDLQNIRANKTTFSVAHFFSQVGALSREISVYKNEARGLSIPASKINDIPKIDFSNVTGKPQETVSLRIKTKDGDTIEIQIQHKRGSVDSLGFSFTVTGKLSKEEQDALEKLASKLGEVADEYFRTGNTVLHGLKDFDKSQLQSFHIDFSKPKGDTYATMSYDYSIDEATQTQHLKASDADGYNVDISSDLKNLLAISNNTNHGMNAGVNSLREYLDIIQKAFNQHRPLSENHSNRLNTQFIIDAFTTMIEPAPTASIGPSAIDSHFTDANLTDAMLDQGLAENGQLAAAFSTGLPDFSATLRTPVFQNNTNFLMPEALILNLGQHTSSELQNDGRLLIKQTNSVEQISSQIKGIIGSVHGDLHTGNYIYEKIHEKQQISRFLDIAHNNFNNLITEQTHSKDNSKAIYNNFKLQDTKIDKQYNRQITELNDDHYKQKKFKSILEDINTINKSHQHLFSQ